LNRAYFSDYDDVPYVMVQFWNFVKITKIMYLQKAL